MAASEYCRVLIVDDEVLIRQGIKHFMAWEQEGFHIVGEASNGQEALERIAELRPHIVITDIVMPVMDGEELTRQIKQHYPEIEVIVLSSFGEFDYVRSTFQSGVADYILKPKLDLQHLLTVLKMTAQRIPSLGAKESSGGGYAPSLEQKLERLLSGYDADFSADELRETFPHPLFLLAGFDPRVLEEGVQPSAVQLQEKLTGLLASSSSSERNLPVIRALPIEGQLRAVLINADQSAMDEAVRIAGMAAVSLSAAGQRIPIAVTNPFPDVKELRDVYNGSLTRLLGYAFYLPDMGVLQEGKLPPPVLQTESFHLNRFTEDFKRGQFHQAFHYLRDHAKAMAGDYTTDVFAFKSFLGNLVFNITVLLGNMEYDARELEKDKYRHFKAIEDAKSASEALNCLDAFIAEAEACISDKAALPGNANMKKLLDYIHQHYAEPLNLTDMAKHFHFNASYLSSYFSAHNSEGFVDYLHKVRIEKAEELLRKGDAMISEISGMVGYSDHSYFCKVFKKSTGLSPSRYRRQFVGEEKGRV
ncbi:two-component system response regulator [Paenibacillus sp. MY03]|uniref:response regulator transcription factor n=1 Tax=Paenibacillus sp. MY03 TaxID=302980 RepID=UPI000B3BFDA9|nr:response regulator transcription factor [Paenibacillus sp. MY03]OUS69789.1 two-component system response regulator [Paenibacillus sp. MY03]